MHVVARAHRLFDVEVSDMVRRARTAVSVPCRKGCAHCCFDIALVSEIEAEYIAAVVRKLPTAFRKSIEQRIVAWIARMTAAGIDVDDAQPDIRTWHRAHVPCPLLRLHNGTCAVYAARPLACRGHYVVNIEPAACANRADEPSVPCIVVDAPMLDALVTIGATSVAPLPTMLADALGLRDSGLRESVDRDQPGGRIG